MWVLRAADGGTPRDERIYYRCAARSIVPGTPILAIHPKNVYLSERAIVGPVNAWIGTLFDPEHRDETVRRLLGADASRTDTARGAAVGKAVAEAEQRLRRLHAAIEAGVDPAALVEPINRAQEELEAARVERQHVPAARTVGQAELEAMIDYLGDIGAALNRADPVKLEELYRSLRLEVIYHPEERTADVTIRPGRGGERVRGGLAY